VTNAIPAFRLLRSAIDPRANALVAREAILTLWRHRQLCGEMTKRDLGGQFAGQMFARFWVFGHPLLLFAVYIFLFAIVLRVRIPETASMPRDYTTYILAGLAPWLTIQQALARTSSSLISQANIVKQVVFPVEVLPCGAVLVAFVPFCIGVTMLTIYTSITGSVPPATYLLLPLVVFLLFLFLTGLGFLLAALTPFFRDLKDIVAVLTMIGVYMVPAFYLPQWIPPFFKVFLYINPFSYVIWVFQDILYYGSIVHVAAWIVLLIISPVSFVGGYRVFRAVRPYVANVL